jgi:hypothetical protein
MTSGVIDTTPIQVESSPMRGARVRWRAQPLRRALQRIAFWCVIIDIAIVALIAGLILRRYVWDQTEPVRFVFDINNCFRQGTETLRTGYLNRYDEVYGQHTFDQEFQVDYAPGRLAISMLWTKYVRTKLDGPGQDWRFIDDWPQQFYARARNAVTPDGKALTPYDLVRPLLMINTAGELLSAIAIFLLVRRWTSGQPLWSPRPVLRERVRVRVIQNLDSRWFPKSPSPQPAPRVPFDFAQGRPGEGELPIARSGAKPVILGLIAALFFWFNLAVLWNAHAWPQWDSWVLPFLLWAVLAASFDWWFTAGVLIAVGAMFKGQILFGAPLFILWPLWRFRPLAIARWIIGAAAGIAACTGVWLLRSHEAFNPDAIRWVAAMTIAFILLIVALRPRWQWYVSLPIATIACGIILWQFPVFGGRWVLAAGGATLLVGAIAMWASWRAIAYAATAWASTSVLLCAVLFGGSMAWFHIGIAYGTHRYMSLTRGPDDNLPAILEEQYQWHEPMETAMTIPPGRLANWIGPAVSSDGLAAYTPGQPLDIPLRYLLLAIYATAVVLCSIGAAIHSKRGSSRFLIAVVAPWIVMFAVLPQMHERYLLWGAALSAMTVAISPGLALLHLLLSVVACSQEAQQMLNLGIRQGAVQRDNIFLTIFRGWNPGMGWAVMLCAAIFVYLAVAPQRRRLRNN